MMTKILLTFSLLLSASQLVFSQDPKEAVSQLKNAFENRTAVLLMDMPADSSGIDLWPEKPEILNVAERDRRIKYYKVSLYEKSSVTITKVTVVKRKIELHLNGGGYVLPKIAPLVVVPLSRRGKWLQEELAREYKKKPLNRKYIASLEEELAEEIEIMNRINAANRRKYEADKRRRDAASVIERPLHGSRFTLNFRKTSPFSVTPGAVTKWLEKYVDFSTPANISAESKRLTMPYMGEWQNSKGETFRIDGANLYFGSGTGAGYREVFRLMSENAFVIEASESQFGRDRFILIKATDSKIKLTFYESLEDLKNGTNSKREETLSK